MSARKKSRCHGAASGVVLNAVLNAVVNPVVNPVVNSVVNPVVNEVREAVYEMKPDKAAGIDGVTPDILLWLSHEWIIVVTDLFNHVFFGE